MRISRFSLGDVTGMFPGSTVPGTYKDLSQTLQENVLALTQNPASGGSCLDDIVAGLAQLADPSETPCNLMSVSGSGYADPNCANPGTLVAQAQAQLRSALTAKAQQMLAWYPNATLADMAPYLPCGTTSLPAASAPAPVVSTPVSAPVSTPNTIAVVAPVATSPQTPGISTAQISTPGVIVPTVTPAPATADFLTQSVTLPLVNVSVPMWGMLAVVVVGLLWWANKK